MCGKLGYRIFVVIVSIDDNGEILRKIWEKGWIKNVINI